MAINSWTRSLYDLSVCVQGRGLALVVHKTDISSRLIEDIYRAQD